MHVLQDTLRVLLVVEMDVKSNPPQEVKSTMTGERYEE